MEQNQFKASWRSYIIECAWNLMKYGSYGAKPPPKRLAFEEPASKTKENQQANVGRLEMDLGRQPLWPA